MRHITIIGPAYPYRGGIAHFSSSLSNAFKKRGIETTLVTFSLQYPGVFFPGTSQFDEGPPPQDLKIFRWLHSINPISWFRTAKRIRKLDPDLVIVQYWMPFLAPCLGTVCRLIRNRSGIKVISIVHNVTPHEGGLMDRQLSKYFFRSCDGFITLSSSVLDDLARYHPGAPVRTVPHPMYSFFGEKLDRGSACSHLGLDPQKKYLLFFGLIRPYKGLDLILKALDHPHIRSMNICLLVAGEFYEKKEIYQKIIDDLEIGDKVILSDKYIPDGEVKYFFSAADLVVQPYKSATQSGVTQIAYQFERPTLVTHVGGLPELVSHMETGYVTGLSEEDIAEAIHDFFEHKREHQFVKKIRNFKHRFQWDHVVSELDALDQLLKANDQE